MAIQDSFAPSVWREERKTLSASSTINISEFDSNYAKAGKCIFTAFNEVQGKTSLIEIGFINENGSIKDRISGKLGNSISLNVETKVSAGKVFIEIQNNETFDLVVNAAYLILK